MRLLNYLPPQRHASSYSPLSIPNATNKSSTTLPQVFLCLPLQGFIFHSWLKSCLGYQSSGIDANLYHHFNLALSLQLLKVSIPMSPLTASLHVLEEQPKIFLAPPSIIDSNALACSLLNSHTLFPYSRLGPTTAVTTSYKHSN